MNQNPYQNQIKQLEAKIKENKELLDDPELRILAKEELTKLNKQKKSLKKAAKEYEEALKEQEEAKKDPTKKSAAILEIRAGAGGDEAKIWAADLMRMYLRYSQNKGLKAKIIDDLVIKISGKTEIKVPVYKSEDKEEEIKTKQVKLYPYQLFETEGGVHRVQRIPSTETQGRIHTSTASVAVLPEIKKKDVEIKKENLEWEFMRSSGAGGQSVNKTNSAVRLTHEPTGITVRVTQERKQLQNREIALELLRSQLWQKQEQKRKEKLGEARAAIGRNRRAEKIRTYNFPQNRITDHRIHESWYQLEEILEGDLDEVIGEVKAHQLLEAKQENPSEG
jgi:peptide chain release factor 1